MNEMEGERLGPPSSPHGLPPAIEMQHRCPRGTPRRCLARWGDGRMSAKTGATWRCFQSRHTNPQSGPTTPLETSQQIYFLNFFNMKRPLLFSFFVYFLLNFFLNNAPILIKYVHRTYSRSPSQLTSRWDVCNGAPLTISAGGIHSLTGGEGFRV